MTLADRWLPERGQRISWRALDPEDFRQLAQAGLTLTGVPVEMCGVWETPERSSRPIAEMFRCLARVDPSLALVATMHPTVLTA